MQFNGLAFVLAALASVASAEKTVTVYACSSSAISSGFAAPTVASTGVYTAPTPTGSPITYVTGAASVKGVSALGMIVAGGVALFL